MDKKQLALKVYDTMIQALDQRNWNYEKDVEKNLVHFNVSGEDLPIKFIMWADEDRQLIRILSPLCFKFPEENRIEGAIAACHASYALSDGCFDYDLSEGSISFRLTNAFHESEIGVDLIQYMISCTCVLVDEYNDRFLMLAKGMIDLQTFLSKE
ncbi:MAG: hypothetical protein IJ315_02520 [Firmicutes bacterium]|nr:hypothetical protein [Bacillota bacterium]